MIALDTETTGLDLEHGCRPFIVTLCNDEGVNTWWEWDVDPKTRSIVHKTASYSLQEDLADIQEEIDKADGIALQHSKFDVTALDLLFSDCGMKLRWPWEKTHDTLYSAHLLASNQPRDLGTLSLIYIRKNIKPLEFALAKIAKDARKEAERLHPNWRIARAKNEKSDGLPELPSTKGKVWQSDLWLPRTIARFHHYPKKHEWWHSAYIYANGDSSATIGVHLAHMKKLKDRGLEKLYAKRLELMPIVYGMQRVGVTESRERMDQLEVEYRKESDRLNTRCKGLAKAGFDFNLTLPKSGTNNSLRDFMFGPECKACKGHGMVLLEGSRGSAKEVCQNCWGKGRKGNLDLPVVSVSKKTKQPSLDAEALEEYEAKLPLNSKGYHFAKALREKRKRDTSLSYMESYRRFWLPIKTKGEENATLSNQSDKPRIESPKEIPSEGRQEQEMLALESGEIPKRLRPVPRFGGTSGPSDKLHSASGGNTEGPVGTSQVRQSRLRKSETLVSRDTSGQHERHDSEGEGRQSSRSSTPSGSISRKGHIGNKKPSSKRGEASRDSGEIQNKSLTPLRDCKQKILEAPEELSAWYRLFPSLNPTGTNTLRWTSQQPNEQNISKKSIDGFSLRYAFGPLPGREWWAIDAANIELRLPAYEAGETEMIALFERPNDAPYYGSYHLLVFDTLHPKMFAKHGTKVKELYKSSWYQWTKNGNFAVQYGAVESSGTADRAYHVPGAQKRIQKRFAKIADLNQEMIATANRQGYVETIPDKTVDPDRGYPLLCTRSNRGRILPTIPLNYHIQGSACWWIMKAMIRVQAILDEYNENRVESARAFMNMQVHDELVFDFPKSKTDPTEPQTGFDRLRNNLPLIKKIARAMEKGGDDFGIPTPVNVTYHPENWGEGIDVAA